MIYRNEVKGNEKTIDRVCPSGLNSRRAGGMSS